LYTKEADAYSVEKVAQHFWNDKWNKDLFKGPAGASIFFSKLNALTHEDPKKRPSLSSLLEIFTSNPHNFESSNCCFRYGI
jgi:hypothetical protein